MMFAGNSISQTLQVLRYQKPLWPLWADRPECWGLALEKDRRLTAQDDGEEFAEEFEDDEDDEFEDDLDEFEDDFDDEFDDDEDDDEFDDEDF